MIEVRFESDLEEMPKNCGLCDYCDDSDGRTGWSCRYGYDIDDWFRFEQNTAKPDWCPLREIPDTVNRICKNCKWFDSEYEECNCPAGSRSYDCVGENETCEQWSKLK